MSLPNQLHRPYPDDVYDGDERAAFMLQHDTY